MIGQWVSGITATSSVPATVHCCNMLYTHSWESCNPTRPMIRHSWLWKRNHLEFPRFQCKRCATEVSCRILLPREDGDADAVPSTPLLPCGIVRATTVPWRLSNLGWEAYRLREGEIDTEQVASSARNPSDIDSLMQYDAMTRVSLPGRRCVCSFCCYHMFETLMRPKHSESWSHLWFLVSS